MGNPLSMLQVPVIQLTPSVKSDNYTQSPVKTSSRKPRPRKGREGGGGGGLSQQCSYSYTAYLSDTS